MFNQDIISIEIDSSNIKILVGNKKRVTFFGTIKTPEESFMDDRIINVDLLASEIGIYLRKNSVKVKNVGFVIRGKDIIIRHKEVPAVDIKSIRENVEWEFRQSLPQNGANHYVDCELIEKNKTSAKVLVAAVTKGRVDNYVELANKLGLNIKVVDVSGNCTARVFKNVTNGKKVINSAGIIEFGKNSTNFIILDKGSLFMNREVSFGLSTLYTEISRSTEEIAASKDPYEYLVNHINLNDLVHRNRFEDNGYEGRIINLFDNVFNSFMRALEFYTAGKTNKELELVFVVGEGCTIPGLGGYIKNYFTSQVAVVNSAKKLNLNIKIPAGCELKDYINTLGLLLRKES